MQERKKGMLAGVRVLEYSSYAACSNVGKLLGLWGAEVIKVEPPGGEIFRVMGTLTNLPITPEENPAFQLCNSNKKGVTINTKTPEGKALFHKLLASCDVFLTNVRMASLIKNGFGWEELHEKYPALVYCHISGWGLKGPQAGESGFDTACYWAVSGALADLAPAGGPPIPPSYGVGDQHMAVYGAAGICAALFHRAMTGEGSFAAPSLLGVGAQGHGMMTTYCQKPYQEQGLGMRYPIGHFNPSYPTFNSYQCSDGEWVMITITEYAEKLPKFCEVFGIPASVYTDPRFSTVEEVQKPENLRAMVEHIDAAIGRYTSREVVEMMTAADMVATTYVHFTDFAENEQAHINGNFEYFTFENGHTVSFPANPVLFNGGEDNYHLTPAPKPGEHNEEVFTALGYAPEELERLREAKII
ncbi:MAG: CoA transferase [Oscillospiraceae bacterium]|nr:CoA transferase [Oscillospiraceae bacterium]